LSILQHSDPFCLCTETDSVSKQIKSRFIFSLTAFKMLNGSLYILFTKVEDLSDHCISSGTYSEQYQPPVRKRL